MSQNTPRVTAPHRFIRCNSVGNLLFEVRGGIPLANALEQASCYMAAAKETASVVAGSAIDDDPAGALWAAFYLIEMAAAVVDSALNAALEEEKRHG